MDDTQGQQPLTSDPTPIGAQPDPSAPAVEPAPASRAEDPFPGEAGQGPAPEPAARHEDEAFARCRDIIENLLGPDAVRRNVVDRLRSRFYGLE